MESAAALRSFYYSAGTTSHLQTLLGRPDVVTVNNATFSNMGKWSFQDLANGKSIFSSRKPRGLQIACVKTSEIKLATKSNDSCQNGSLDNSMWRAPFPNAFEELIAEVCDETEIAELKLKVGDLEMHLKRNLAAKAPPVVSSPPLIPSKPVVETAPSAALSQPKASSEKVSPFTYVSPEKATKLAALEALGASGYVLVASPTVGSFRRARTLKGKKQPPACKEFLRQPPAPVRQSRTESWVWLLEVIVSLQLQAIRRGDQIKEGQVIGFLDQFGTQLPVRSDEGGEVLKVLYKDGEAVGYGDPLIAVLPSFHGIN